MKNIAFLLTLFFSVQVFAQTDSAEINAPETTYTSIASLSKEDVERLPATSFLELVQGAFPFISNTSNIEEDYTYLVNGFVTINPNAIDLSQIESIHFYPTGTMLTRGSLVKKGTFVISTHPQKSRIHFSTKSGLLQSGKSPGGAYIQSEGAGFTTFNDFSVQHKGERSFISSAVSYLKDNYPDKLYYSQNSHSTINTNLSRIRLSNFAGIQLNQLWSLEGGLLFTSQPQNGHSLVNYPSTNSLQKQTRTQQTMYAGGHAGLRFSPSEKLSNQLTAEITYTEEDVDHLSNTTSPSGPNYQGFSNADGNYRTYAFTDHLTWRPLITSAMTLQASMTARYWMIKTEEGNQTVSTSSQGPIYSSSRKTLANSSSMAVSPAISFALKKMVFAEVGATYDSYQNSFAGANQKRKIYPNAGLRLQLAPLIQGSGIVSLELSSNFQQYLRTYEQADRLETDFLPAAPTVLFPNVDRENTAYTPSKNWLNTLTIAGWENRFSIKAGYRMHDRTIKAYLPVWIGSGTGYVLVHEPLTSKSWSLELKTTLIEKQGKKWTVYTMAVQDKFERKRWGNSPYSTVSTPAEPFFADAGKAPWRAGLRTAVNINRFFLQAAALINLNEAANNRNGTFVDDMTTYRTSFLLAGYQWLLHSKMIKGLEANLQSRNLLSTKYNAPQKYIGAGVHLLF